ncbi:MAG: PrsW family intramembrane metalloprotease [Armatimonadetes bacterium]|nr:PrsW family intramembrane metalloprotease [Armatimonadota bacterium]
MDVLLFLLATVPGVALLVYFYRHDRLEPEPKELVIGMACVGALSSLVACWVELSLLPFTWHWSAAAHALLMVGLPEELCKLTAVLLIIYWNPEFDEPYDGVVYCVAAGMGFAILENLRYVYDQGAATGVLRGLLTVPAHALFGVCLGYFMGQARFTRSRLREVSYLAGGLACAVLMHGLYDYLVYEKNSLVSLLLFPMVGIFWVVGLWQVDRNVSLSPYRYVQEGGEPDPRRAWLRIQVRLDGEVDSGGERVGVDVLDVGMGGARIESGRPLAQKRSHVLATLAGQPLGLEFDVLLVRKDRDTYVHHCRFATLSWRMQKRLEVILKPLL